MTLPDNIIDKMDLFRWLVDNKSMIINQKKSILKRSDSVFNPLQSKQSCNVVKSTPDNEDLNDIVINRKCVINTTNFFDSHYDVHIDGLWKKSISENKVNYLVQEHNFTFKGIITDNVKVSADRLSWVEIGYPQYHGYTQALIFDSVIDKIRNPYMFEQYKLDRVRNHSVGMRYMDVLLAVNSDEYPDELKVWNKYYDRIANKTDVDNVGFFFPVLQAKIIEGSAVVIGSNTATPTLNAKFHNESTNDDESPIDGTLNDSPQTKWDLLTAIENSNFTKTIKNFY